MNECNVLFIVNRMMMKMVLPPKVVETLL